MENFEDIKKLWNSKSISDLPNSRQMQAILRNYQTKKKQTIFLVITLFVFCCIGFGLVIAFHNSLLWTTTIGETLIALGFILGLILKLNTLKEITRNELKSNKDFLQDLLKATVQKKSQQNWLLIVSILLLVIGYGFFIYKDIRDNQSELILCYFGMASFTLGMYFVFRPFLKRVSKNKTLKMFEELEKLY